MYDTICYFGLSAHDFTEISAARKALAPSAELRFFTTAVELLDHVTYSHATRTLVFLDARVLDPEWELVRRLSGGEAGGNLRVVLLSMAAQPVGLERARVAACLPSPLQPAALRDLCLGADLPDG